MTQLTALLLLLGIGLALTLSLVCWRGLRALGERMGRSTPPVATSRWARSLLVASLVIPLLMPAAAPGLSSWFDEFSLQAVPAPVLGEELVAPAAGTEAPAVARGGAVAPGPAASASVWRSALRSHGTSMLVLCWWLLTTGWALSAAVFLKRWAELRSRVQGAVCLRRQGHVRVAVSDDLSVPFATRALLRADVVLPVSLLGRTRDLHLALRHELHHHRRGDGWWSLGLESLKGLFFWNPAMGAWARELSELQELACDAQVLARGVNRADYADCMLRIAAEATHEPAFAAAAMSPAGDLLRRRLNSVLGTTPEAGAGSVRVTALLVVGLLSAGAWFCGQAWAKRPVEEGVGVRTARTPSSHRAELLALREELQAWPEDSKSISKLKVLADRSRVRIKRISPGRPVKHDYHDSYPLTLDFEGSLRDVGLWLTRIAEWSRPVQVRILALRHATEGTSAEPGYVDGKVRLERYIGHTPAHAPESGEPGRAERERAALDHAFSRGDISERDHIHGSNRITNDAAAWLRVNSEPARSEEDTAEEIRALRALLVPDDRALRTVQLAVTATSWEKLSLGKDGLTGSVFFEDRDSLGEAIKAAGTDVVKRIAMVKGEGGLGVHAKFGSPVD